jgi:hypothetical protein
MKSLLWQVFYIKIRKKILNRIRKINSEKIHQKSHVEKSAKTILAKKFRETVCSQLSSSRPRFSEAKMR